MTSGVVVALRNARGSAPRPRVTPCALCAEPVSDEWLHAMQCTWHDTAAKKDPRMSTSAKLKQDPFLLHLHTVFLF